MAQTKRRRQTKHRGNAAGFVESRGRTGRKPTAAEKSGDAREVVRARETPLDRRDRPPTWRAAFIKAMVAGVLFLLAVMLLVKNSNGALAVFPFVIAGYTLISYYTDRWVYNRRQRKKAEQADGGKAPAR
jgi:hypothetical protein